MELRKKITPFLWFDGNAEEAVNYYVSIFKHSRILNVSHHGDAGPMPKGTVMTITFELEGEPFVALNGGPQYKFNEAVSFLVKCDNQAEVDELWGRLTAGGEEIACGWLKDRFGLVWQVVPSGFFKLMDEKHPEKTNRVMQAMFKMKKLDLPVLERAYRGEL